MVIVLSLFKPHPRSAMSRLETKLDIMLADDHIRPRDLLHVGSGHDEVRARHRKLG